MRNTHSDRRDSGQPRADVLKPNVSTYAMSLDPPSGPLSTFSYGHNLSAWGKGPAEHRPALATLGGQQEPCCVLTGDPETTQISPREGPAQN